ncbi:L-2-hydroxyglutarate dehydrogenase, mitochondrial-like [Anoplophora glabripennis]|uniref:L-2-hydroxyglutarate dehydrogenase, mitochondrial-like n=1 Tax=Anoplophora glabripennis TaxID=217634 RepID=UPI0008740F0F|nr:L-2-hydroxyglutarate dehydrogenase, mitochondrial-like [Anoplophora glabripennis]
MLWTKENIRQIEPKCNGIQALWCPKVGNINWGTVTQSLGKEFQKNGGFILLNNQVDVIKESDTPDYPIFIKTKEGSILRSKYLVICGGLQSQVLSNIVDEDSKRKSSLISLRVDYLFLKTSSIGTNIYGVPDLTIPFLGVHITPRMDGGLLLGPNAVPAFKIEGYSNDEINFIYLKDTISSASFQNMTRRYFPQCFGQVKKALWPRFHIEELLSLADISEKDIQEGPAAVLGQLVNNDGSFVDDFRIEFFEGKGIGSRVINCKFLPSPAATCSLAIAEYVGKKLFRQFEI